eukprot:m.358776 g.358776  ORF g.358776 m.358776 type:complete len:182 (+) comp55987_c0_seq49:1384-1929(+)
MISPLVAFAKRHRWQLELFIFVVVLSGGAVMLFPVARNFESLLAILVAMGVAGGAIVTLIPVLVADFIPQQDMSRTMGIISSAQGPSLVLGAPVAGWMMESSGSYTAAFEMSGAVVVASSVFILILICYQRRHPESQRSSTEQPTATASADSNAVQSADARANSAIGPSAVRSDRFQEVEV